MEYNDFFFENLIRHKDSKYIWNLILPLNSSIFNIAVKSGNLDCIIWLKKQSCNWNENTFNIAIKKGNLEILEWLKKEGCFIDTNNAYLYSLGNYNVIEWLKKENIYCDENIYNFITQLKLKNYE